MTDLVEDARELTQCATAVMRDEQLAAHAITSRMKMIIRLCARIEALQGDLQEKETSTLLTRMKVEQLRLTRLRQKVGTLDQMFGVSEHRLIVGSRQLIEDQMDAVTEEARVLKETTLLPEESSPPESTEAILQRWRDDLTSSDGLTSFLSGLDQELSKLRTATSELAAASSPEPVTDPHFVSNSFDEVVRCFVQAYRNMTLISGPDSTREALTKLLAHIGLFYQPKSHDTPS